jgi:hypothetical protein
MREVVMQASKNRGMPDERQWDDCSSSHLVTVDDTPQLSTQPAATVGDTVRRSNQQAVLGYERRLVLGDLPM